MTSPLTSQSCCAVPWTHPAACFFWHSTHLQSCRWDPHQNWLAASADLRLPPLGGGRRGKKPFEKFLHSFGVKRRFYIRCLWKTPCTLTWRQTEMMDFWICFINSSAKQPWNQGSIFWKSPPLPRPGAASNSMVWTPHQMLGGVIGPPHLTEIQNCKKFSAPCRLIISLIFFFQFS